MTIDRKESVREKFNFCSEKREVEEQIVHFLVPTVVLCTNVLCGLNI